MFLSCKFKHDEMNCAWWSGCWYGHGLGMYVMLQLAHNFIVKIIELLLWSSNVFLGHFLFMLTPLLLVPYINCIHVTMLCKYFYFSHSLHLTILIDYFVLVWLWPSKHISALLYPVKQYKQCHLIISCTFFWYCKCFNAENVNSVQVIKYSRYRDQVQAQGPCLSDLECDYYFNVLWTFVGYQPYAEFVVPSSYYRW